MAKTPKSGDEGKRTEQQPIRKPSHDHAWDHKEHVRKDSDDGNQVTDWMKPPKPDSEKKE